MPKLTPSGALIVAVALCLTAENAARAQTSASSPASSSATSTKAPSATADSSAAPPAGKKVWTNEDVGELHDEPISTFAKPARASTPTKPRGAGGPNSQQLLNEIKKLQGQMPPLDNQIAQLQAAIDGQPTGDGKSSARPYGVKLSTWQEQLAELQKKREDTLTRIGELEDQARHNGVPANSIP